MTTETATLGAGLPYDQNMLAVLDVALAMVRDVDGTIRFWSAGAEQLYGWPRSLAIGRSSHELLATRFPEPLDAIHAELLREGAWHGELRHRTRDGRELSIASHWALQRDADGRPGGIIEINSDISFQREGAEAMRRLAAIVESSRDAIIGKALDGTVTAWNRAAEAMFGWRAEEIIGQPIIRLFPPDRVAEEAVIQQRIARGDLIDRYETVRRRKDGTDFPVSLTVSPIHDETGAVVGASKLVRDLTTERASEQRLRDVQSELFHVQRLTELGQLVSALVHEVNQPLAAIGNYSAAGKRLLTAGQVAAAGAALQKITEQTERAHQIIQRLRNFVRKSDGDQRTEHLPTLIQEAVALVMASLREQRLALETRLDPRAVRVTADRVQVQQVLFNLLRNAVEAMEHAPRREVVITAALAEEGMVEVGVADTGSGLSPEVRASLFRPFVTTKDGGMGVGLSVCRSIVEAHGGRMWAEDNPGGGTLFRFTLPYAPETDAVAAT